MVIWTIFAVIVLLCGTTCAKTDYDLRRTSSASMDLLHRGFPLCKRNALTCRYSKLLSVLKENFNIDETEATSFDNVKTKKNQGTELIEVHPRYDSLEDNAREDTINFEDDDKSGNYLNSNDDFDFLKEGETKKSTNSPNIGCDCKIKNDLLDLGHLHYPRYLLNAVCQKDDEAFEYPPKCWRGAQCKPLEYKNDLLDLGHLHYPRYLLNAVCQKDDEAFEYPPKCWRGAQCKPLEYKVRVLTYRSHSDHLQKDPAMSLLPDVLRSVWKFKTVTVAAGCFCS